MATKPERVVLTGKSAAAYTATFLTDDNAVVTLDILAVVVEQVTTLAGDRLPVQLGIVPLVFSRAFLKPRIDWGFGDRLQVEGVFSALRPIDRPNKRARFYQREQVWRRRLRNTTLHDADEPWPSGKRRLHKWQQDFALSKLSWSALLTNEERLYEEAPTPTLKAQISVILHQQYQLRRRFEHELDQYLPVSYAVTAISHVTRDQLGIAPDRLPHDPQRKYFDQPGYVHQYFMSVSAYYRHWRTLGLPVITPAEVNLVPPALAWLADNHYQPFPLVKKR